MNESNETASESTPSCFQFSIVNFLEAITAIAIVLSLAGVLDAVPFFAALIIFFFLKSVATVVAISHRVSGTVMYSALVAPVLFVLPILLIGQILPPHLFVDWTFISLFGFGIPSLTFAFDLDHSFVRPRTLIWRPFVEIVAWAILIFPFLPGVV